MPDFQITRGRMGSEPVVTVSAAGTSTRIVLALRGATLLSWQADGPAGPVQLTDGYRDADELLSQDGVRNGLLAPFPNRIAQGRYRFDGREYDLLPGRRDRLIYHGFIRTAPFELVEATTTAGGAVLRLRTHIAPGRHLGYPFALDVQATYTIGRNTVDIDIDAANTGSTPAPYGAGWHPYFRLSRTVDDLTLQIPADTVIRTDDALIPLPGDTARTPVDQLPLLDFRTPSQIGARVIDTCFTDLRLDDTGRAETVLADPTTGEQIRVWQNAGSMHVYTGDTLARNQRRSVALEPVESITDAFNRDELASQIHLEAGGKRQFGFGVSYHTSAQAHEQAPSHREPGDRP